MIDLHPETLIDATAAPAATPVPVCSAAGGVNAFDTAHGVHTAALHEMHVESLSVIAARTAALAAAGVGAAFVMEAMNRTNTAGLTL